MDIFFIAVVIGGAGLCIALSLYASHSDYSDDLNNLKTEVRQLKEDFKLFESQRKS